MRNYLHLVFCIFLLLLSQANYAQPKVAWSPPTESVFHGERELKFPWDGGLNASQINFMDLNKDGNLDLVIFDRSHMKLSTYLSTPDGNYSYHPRYEYYFPSDITGWLVLRDFDGDGLADIFTSHPLGIKIYRQVASQDPFPKWEVYLEPLLVQGTNRPTNIQLNSYDVPAISDVDGDGDLDILVFNFATGSSITYFKNMAVENRNRTDTLEFIIESRKFGDLLFCDCGEFAFGEDDCGTANARIEHVGGHSLLVYDYNGDGKKDLILSDELCDQLYLVPNKSSLPGGFSFDEFETIFPGQSSEIKIPYYPAAYEISPNQLLLAINMEPGLFPEIDYQKNHYAISRSGGNWNIDTRAWMQEEMIDWGAQVYVSVDEDEMILSKSVQGGTSARLIRYLRNQGAWQLESEDFWDYGGENWDEIQFQILEAKKWLVFKSNGGDAKFLDIYEEVSGNREKTQTNIELPAHHGDYLEVFTEGENTYILVGKPSGRLELWGWNAFPSSSPTLIYREFLGIRDDFSLRFPRFQMVKTEGGNSLSLIMNTFEGKVRWHSDINIEINSSKMDFVQLNTGNGEQAPWNLGRFSTPRFETNNRGSFIWIGSSLGGVQRYGFSLSNEDTGKRKQANLNIYPNPNYGNFQVVSDQDCFASLIDLSGRILVEKVVLNSNEVVNIQMPELAEGIYVLKTYGEKIRPTIHRVLIRKAGF